MGDFKSRPEKVENIQSRNSKKELNLKESVKLTIDKSEFELLYHHDQFYMDFKAEKVGKQFGFLEGNASLFPPTFKLK